MSSTNKKNGPVYLCDDERKNTISYYLLDSLTHRLVGNYQNNFWSPASIDLYRLFNLSGIALKIVLAFFEELHNIGWNFGIRQQNTCSLEFSWFLFMILRST